MTKSKEHVYAELLKRLESGDYPVGSKMPPERKIASELDVTLWSVHKAMNDLEEKGLIERRRSVGTFVKGNASRETMTLLRNRNSHMVGIVVARNFFYSNWGDEDLLSNLEQKFTDKGCTVSYLELPKTANGLKSFFSEMNEVGIRALIVFPEYEEWEFLYHNSRQFQQQPVDVFVFNRGLGADDSFPFNMISLDMMQSGFCLADYLVENDFNKIAFCSSDRIDKSYWLAKRFTGFKRGMESHQRKADTFIAANFEALYPRVADYIQHADSCPALVCATDEIALMFMENMSNYALKAGEHYVIFGFDNHPSFRRNNLNTIGWPLDNAAELLVKGVNEFAMGIPHDNYVVRYVLKPTIIDQGKSIS